MHRFALPLALLTALALVACGDMAPSKTGGGQDHGDHDHHGEEGPNGGAIGEIGDHVAHLEMIVDHGRHAVIAHVLTHDNEPMRIKDVPVLNLVFESGPKQIKGKAVDENADGASEWHFRDELLAGEPESGKFRIVVKGKPYVVELAHDHEGHDHDHGEEGHDDHEDHDHDEDGEDHDEDHDHDDHDEEDGDHDDHDHDK